MTICGIRQILLYVLNIDHLELPLQPETYKKCGKKTKQKKHLEYLNVPSILYECILTFAFGFRHFNSPAKAAFSLQNCLANNFSKDSGYAREVMQVQSN